MNRWNRLLAVEAHRPYPLPAERWLMTMTWQRLLFAHWPVPTQALRALIPDNLNLDLWDSTAWLGIVPFEMVNVGPPGLNGLPWLSKFPEINVRTYVIHDGRPGVLFLSLDAANSLACLGARVGFRLPYYWAAMALEQDGDQVRYRSKRRLGPAARFEAEYGPCGPAFSAQAGSFEAWLVERYCLYTHDRRGRVLRGEIQHQPWKLQPAEASFAVNEMVQWCGIELPVTPPILHYADTLDVLAWALVAA